MSSVKKNLQLWLNHNPSMKAKQLSLKAGLGATAVRDILKGHSQSPRRTTLDKLAVAMGVTSEWLLSGPHESPPKPGMLFKSATGMNEAIFRDVFNVTLQFIQEYGIEANSSQITNIVFALYEILEDENSQLSIPLDVKDLKPYAPFISRLSTR